MVVEGAVVAHYPASGPDHHPVAAALVAAAVLITLLIATLLTQTDSCPGSCLDSYLGLDPCQSRHENRAFAFR